MTKINQLESLNLRELIDQTHSRKKADPGAVADQKDFGETISEFVKAVNESQKESSKAVADVIEGRSENLHQAMATMEEAGLSFKLMIEIRNRLLESYKEIQRMQV